MTLFPNIVDTMLDAPMDSPPQGAAVDALAADFGLQRENGETDAALLVRIYAAAGVPSSGPL